MRILVLLNVNAAGGKARRRLPLIKRRLAKTGHDFDWVTTRSGDEMRTSILGARAAGVDAVLLAGGDGTVHEALPAIESSGLPFGLLPCGRGNDFARNINISPRLQENLWIGAPPMVEKIDLPRINGRPFGSIACLGFDATVNDLARNGGGFFGGSLGYIICVIRALWRFEPFEVELALDGQRWAGRIMMVAVANGSYYGGGMKIAPAADMSDGLLDICVVKEVSRIKLIRNFPRVFRGGHADLPDVEMMTAKRVEISCDAAREIFADGEPVGETPAICSVGGSQIEVLRTGN